MQSKKLWITGESYAGTYIPYIANALYKQGNKHNLQGVWIIDGVIVDEDLLNYAVTSDFVATNNDKYLHLTASQVKKINDEAVRCGLGIGKNSYVSKNLNYPPKGPLPAFSHNCRTFDYYYDAAQTQNSAFNIYDISQQVEPNPPSVLGGKLSFTSLSLNQMRRLTSNLLTFFLLQIQTIQTKPTKLPSSTTRIFKSIFTLPKRNGTCATKVSSPTEMDRQLPTRLS